MRHNQIRPSPVHRDRARRHVRPERRHLDLGPRMATRPADCQHESGRWFQHPRPIQQARIEPGGVIRRGGDVRQPDIGHPDIRLRRWWLLDVAPGQLAQAHRQPGGRIRHDREINTADRTLRPSCGPLIGHRHQRTGTFPYKEILIRDCPRPRLTLQGLLGCVWRRPHAGICPEGVGRVLKSHPPLRQASDHQSSDRGLRR